LFVNSCHGRIRNAFTSMQELGPARAVMVIGVISALVWGVCSAVAVASGRDGGSTYYVSVGDSYAAGYRPNGAGPGSTSVDGFVYQLQGRLASRQGGWTTVNFACSGETAYAMTFERGCEPEARAPGGVAYPNDPQSVAAADFVSAHRDRIGLITVAMGANDVIRCLDERDATRAQRCAEVEVPRVILSLDFLLSRIREAVGPRVPIVGVSYINVFAADRLAGDANGERRAEFSAAMFGHYLNPALQETYSKYGASFVDSNSLAGGDLPATEKVDLPDHGTVTAAIGGVCALSYYCSQRDPHPNRAGHALIADEVEKLSGL
jgi:lysophospholipase L1-like esterase